MVQITVIRNLILDNFIFGIDRQHFQRDLVLGIVKI